VGLDMSHLTGTFGGEPALWSHRRLNRPWKRKMNRFNKYGDQPTVARSSFS
jgi:hypothetical protein